MANINEFNYLKNAGFNGTYESLNRAMKFYNDDPETCCKYFREVMETVIEEIFNIMSVNLSYNSKTNIAIIEKILTDIEYNDISTIVLELHNMRHLGNSYSHYNYGRDPYSDRYTNYCAMQKIGFWMVTFLREFPKYYAKYEEKCKKKKKRNLILSIAGGIGSLILVLLGLKKMNE